MENAGPPVSKAGVNSARTSLGTGRLETFSDGVMAIAITLLILEIKIPQLSATSSTRLGEELVKLWPEFGSYMISFLVIGLIWINHHQMFKLLKRTDHYFLVLNIFFLMAIAFLPFPTALLAEYLREGHDQQVATNVYTGSMLAVAIFSTLVGYYAFHKERLMIPGVPVKLVKSILNRYLLGIIIWGIALGVSFVFYQLSLGMFVLFQLFFLLPSGIELDSDIDEVDQEIEE